MEICGSSSTMTSGLTMLECDFKHPLTQGALSPTTQGALELPGISARHEPDRQREKEIIRQTDRHTDNRQSDRESDREREKESDRQSETIRRQRERIR